MRIALFSLVVSLCGFGVVSYVDAQEQPHPCTYTDFYVCR